jgi:hypothetical protein
MYTPGQGTESGSMQSLIARQVGSVLAASAVAYGIFLAVAPLVASKSSFARPIPNSRQLIAFEQLWPDRFVYRVSAELWREFEDADEANQRSPLVIYENDKPLALPHSDHNDIEKFGHGRYAHLKGQGILMSTSDNSDPRTNGRRYYVAVPDQSSATLSSMPNR